MRALPLLLLACLTPTAFASPAPSAIPACTSGGALSPTLASALNHLEGFEYIRHSLDQWRAEGKSLCAQGLVLETNAYRYPRVYLEIQGGPRTLALLFQASSVQAHHNSQQRPWVVLPSVATEALWQKRAQQFSASINEANFPLPTSPEFLARAQATNWGRGIDPASFSVARLGQSQLYVATWLSLVTGSSGGLYTRSYSTKALLLQSDEDGSLAIDASLSGFRDILRPLDDLLLSAAERAPRDSAERLEYLRQLLE